MDVQRAAELPIFLLFARISYLVSPSFSRHLGRCPHKGDSDSACTTCFRASCRNLSPGQLAYLVPSTVSHA